MTEFKGTPGPWVVGNNGYDIHKADQTFEEIATAFERKNAKIIAVAPELLKALQTLLEESTMDHDFESFDSFSVGEKLALSAIEKALGSEAQNV